MIEFREIRGLRELSDHHWGVIRTALFIGALLLAGGAYVVATVARICAGRGN